MSDASQPRRARLVPRGKDDAMEVVKAGNRAFRASDLYIRLLSARWSTLFVLILLLYVGLNLFFAGAYTLSGGIANARNGSFADAFFFSVQTMSTIGYGGMSPVGMVANLLVTLQVLSGFCFFALVTGLVFAKFARPTARVLFSRVAVVCPYEGVPHLMLRLANERNDRIVDANLHLVLFRRERTAEGHEMRRLHDLHLVRSRIPILQLTWLVMHPIDQMSPLYGITREELRNGDVEILASLIGIDETLSQTIHARYSYIAEDIICDAAFMDILKPRGDGRGVDVDYRRFHEVRPLPHRKE